MLHIVIPTECRLKATVAEGSHPTEQIEKEYFSLQLCGVRFLDSFLARNDKVA